MTTDPGELERRVSVLETWLETLTSEAVDVRTLAAGTDRDLADLKPRVLAHQSSLNALAETLAEIRVETRVKFDEVHVEFARVRAEMRAGVAEMRSGFAALAQRLDRVLGEG